MRIKVKNCNPDSQNWELSLTNNDNDELGIAWFTLTNNNIHIDIIEIEEEYQGCGYASLLMKTIAGIATSNGAITLTGNVINSVVAYLHAKVTTGTQQDVDTGVWYSTSDMAKHIQAQGKVNVLCNLV